MEKANITSINYEPSDTIEMQGKRKDIDKYLKKGYYIKEERNGYWVLVKAARLIVTLKNSSCTKTFNMKEEVLDYYGKARISESLVNKFKMDIDNGTITIDMDSEGSYSLK